SVGKSLAETTFAARVQLLQTFTDLQWDPQAPVVADLRQTLKHAVDRLPLDNFLVKPARKWVDRFAEEAAWKSLATEDFQALQTQIARLATIGAPADTEEARRFDYLMLQAELASLQGSAVGPFRTKIQAIASALQ
ncbi:hypothetical protein, partial [Erwinia sp. OPT-41]